MVVVHKMYVIKMQKKKKEYKIIKNRKTIKNK